MAISETAVVGDLAVRIPGATTVFEQFRIDGHRPLNIYQSRLRPAAG